MFPSPVPRPFSLALRRVRAYLEIAKTAVIYGLLRPLATFCERLLA